MGLQSVLEPHQQLLTDRKLPWRRPAGRHGRGYDFGIRGHKRAGLAEPGENGGLNGLNAHDKLRKEVLPGWRI